jgi:hypothetical protein
MKQRGQLQEGYLRRLCIVASELSLEELSYASAQVYMLEVIE